MIFQSRSPSDDTAIESHGRETGDKMTTHYDAIVIGTGQAAPSLAGRMNQEGLKIAVIERKLIGGTCVNVGCVPTKALVASARAAHMARRGADFGVVVQDPLRVDMKRVNARMKEISGQGNKGVTRWIESMENATLYRGKRWRGAEHEDP